VRWVIIVPVELCMIDTSLALVALGRMLTTLYPHLSVQIAQKVISVHQAPTDRSSARMAIIARLKQRTISITLAPSVPTTS
jgi:hypothetical protein